MSSRRRVALIAAFALAALALVLPAVAAAFGPNLSFSTAGTAAGQLRVPGDAAVAPDGSLYVSDFGNRRIDVFSPDGAFQFAFGKEVTADGSGGICTAASGCKEGSVDGSPGSIAAPEGVAIDPAGRIYISERSGRVDVFSLKGQFLFMFANSGGSAAGSLSEARGIGLGADGNVYVADGANNRVSVFSAQGGFLFAFGGGVNSADGSNLCTAQSGCKAGSAGAGAGEIHGPLDVKVGPGGQVFVADPLNSRIEVYSAGGAFQRAFGKAVNPSDGSAVCAAVCQAGGTTGSGAIRAGALEVDTAGEVFAVDPVNNRLSQFSSAGEFRQAFGEGVRDGSEAFQVCLPGNACQAGKKEGKVPGAVTGSIGIAIDCRRGIYSVEHFTDNSVVPAVPFVRVERFADPSPVAPCPSTGTSQPPTTKPPAPKPSNRFRFGRLRLNLERGTATLQVRLPGPGTLVLRGKGIRAARIAVKRAGTVRLAIKPVGAAKRRLLATAKAKLRARVTFTPKGGTPLTRQRPLTLRAALGR